MEQLLIGFALIAIGFLVGLEYGEDIYISTQILKEEVLLFTDFINLKKAFQNSTIAEPILYHEGFAFNELSIEEKEKTWQDEMREDLKFYCPDVAIERIIARFEEIIEDQE